MVVCFQWHEFHALIVIRIRLTGLKTGDVVIQLGGVKVTDMTTYMKALAQFKKGDSSKVKVKRGSETIEHDINF